MLVAKQEIIEWLAETGDVRNAFEVERALPEQVDTDQDRELLEKYGVNIESLLDRRQPAGPQDRPAPGPGDVGGVR